MNCPTEWSIERPSRACVDIRVPFKRHKDWEWRALLTTDRHWDNPKSDWDLQRRHLDAAVECGAPVIDNGDFFCAMQGKYDKRASKAGLRPEHQVDTYLDALVGTASEFFAPYAHQFAVMGDGNHETSIRKHQETDLMERLVGTLNTTTGSNIQRCGYGSWVRFLFYDGNSRQTVKMKRFHGHGGGGPVTKGIIQTNRRAASIDADIIFTGHIHEEWSLTTVREELTTGGHVRHRRQLHVCGATYKEEYGDGDGGWHVERGAPPKPIGAIWLTFRWHGDGGNGRIEYDTQRAF